MFVDTVLFIVFPYTAVVLAVVVGVYRYFDDRFSYSSFSSQFLENRALFWGSVPWHFGIIIILLAHIVALLLPDVWGRVIAEPARLYTLEVIGLALAVSAFLGLVLLFIRRLLNPRVFTVTSMMDWVLLAVLIGEVALGFYVALFYRWGSDWYLHTSVSWLQSLAMFDPDSQFVTSLPWVVKLHILGGFVIIALSPFTRLVHVMTFPFTYLWRPYQVVIWNRRQKQA
ncbi:MAG TPA: respiratory nitrate reductase subunit gamma [Dehalococcoidia bacterium]|nr:respiratory nitrate reductase subunit gamma [Dehalococcoidia bacterium]